MAVIEGKFRISITNLFIFRFTNFYKWLLVMIPVTHNPVTAGIELPWTLPTSLMLHKPDLIYTFIFMVGFYPIDQKLYE